MAGADRMAIEEVVRKVLVDEHADVLRESVEWLARQLMEVEVAGSAPRTVHASRQVSAPAVGHPGR